METPAASPAPAKFLTFTRFRRWLFSWRTLRRCLVGLAVLITLIVAWYTEEAWRGKRAWESYRSQMVANGVELNWKIFVPPPVPDDQNFAMTPFLAPIYNFTPQPLQPGQSAWRDTNGFDRARTFGQEVPLESESARFVPDFRQQLDLEGLLKELRMKSKYNAPAPSFASRADAAAEVLRQLAPYEPVLDELRAASRRPYSRFNIQYDAEDPSTILLPHLGILRHVARILQYRASAELALGKTDAAFDDVEMMFFLAGSIQNEPIVISQLVRMVMLNETSRVIREGLAGHLWSEPQLQQFQTRLEGLTPLKDLAPSLNCERIAMGDGTLELLRKCRRNYFSSELGIAPGTAVNLMWLFPSGWTYFEQVNYNRMFDNELQPGYDPKAGMVHPKPVEAADARVKDLQGMGSISRTLNHRLFSSIMLPFLGGLIQKSAIAQTVVDECAVACALERFRLANGKYPDSLDALVPKFLTAIPHDVITGEPLKYRLTGDGQFILYSVDWNETDDGGKIVMTADGRGIDAAQGDWVWPAYPAK